MLELLQNPYFIIPGISWFVAQLIKFTLKSWKGDTNLRYFFKTGNMPSSHTAMVVALVVTAGFESGLGSSEFGISFVLSSIVIYDALNLRRAVGEQGGVLQRLIERSRAPKAEREKIKISEVLGHSPIEVLAGGSLGLVISFILEHRFWTDALFESFETTTDTQRMVYFILSGALVLIGVVVASIFGRRHLRKLPTSKRIARVARNAMIAPGLTGLLVTYLQQERVSRFTTDVWITLVAVWVVVGLIIGYLRSFRGAIAKLRDEKVHFSQEKKRQRQTRRKKKRRK